MTKKGDYSLIDEKRCYSDKRFNHPKLNEEEIQKFIKLANRKFYSPLKILELIKIFGPRTVLEMVKYSVFSKLI